MTRSKLDGLDLLQAMHPYLESGKITIEADGTVRSFKIREYLYNDELFTEVN